MNIKEQELRGLSLDEVAESRKKNGLNKLEYKKENRVYSFLKSIFSEPMILLLFLASGIYYSNKQYSDAVFLTVSILFIAAISIYQDRRSRNALAALQEFVQPLYQVIRQGKHQKIMTQDIVKGDTIIVEEGSLVPADGVIMRSNDFSVNESILTGESMAVFKDSEIEDNKVFSGTTVASGLAIVKVSDIGVQTRLGKIGTSLEGVKKEKTPLELQIGSFVKKNGFSRRSCIYFGMDYQLFKNRQY